MAYQQLSPHAQNADRHEPFTITVMCDHYKLQHRCWLNNMSYWCSKCYVHVSVLMSQNVQSRLTVWVVRHHLQLIQFQYTAHIQLIDKRILKLWSLFSMCHRLMRRSSADRYVAPSLFTEIELMWYVCALANTRRGLASTMSSIGLKTGTRRDVIDEGSTGEPSSSRRLKPSVRFRRSETFHSFTVLSAKVHEMKISLFMIRFRRSHDSAKAKDFHAYMHTTQVRDPPRHT